METEQHLLAPGCVQAVFVGDGWPGQLCPLLAPTASSLGPQRTFSGNHMVISEMEKIIIWFLWKIMESICFLVFQ